MRKRVARAALVTTIAAVVGACGSTPLSVSQLRSHAASICLGATTQAQRIATPLSPAGGAGFLAHGVAVLRPELAKLRTLRPPSEIAADYSAALGAFSQKLSDLTVAVRDLRRQDDPVFELKALQRRLGPVEARENDAWRTLQIPACVNR